MARARRADAMPQNGAQARFAIGDVVQHVLFDYRGVVWDVDPVFSASEEWYRQMARTKPPKDRPWYRVLVHGGSNETYVAERNLQKDDSGEPIRHPGVDQVFERFEDGAYVPRRRTQ